MLAEFSALAAGLAFASPWLRTSGEALRMEPTDVTIEVLKGIRDELRGANARLDTINAHLDTTNMRLERVEGRLATGLVAVVDAVHEMRTPLVPVWKPYAVPIRRTPA
jgi:hypothetical protein